MKTMKLTFQNLLSLCALLALGGCVPEEKPAMDIEMKMVLPAEQIQSEAPLPSSVQGLIEPLAASGSGGNLWSPWPVIEVIGPDGTVLGTWKAEDPITEADRIYGRTPSAEERMALFLKQFAEKPAGELFPGVKLGKTVEIPGAATPVTLPPPPGSESELLAKMVATLAKQDAALKVFAPNGSAASSSKTAVPCSATAEAIHKSISADLPAPSKEAGKPRVSVLVWLGKPEPEAAPVVETKPEVKPENKAVVPEIPPTPQTEQKATANPEPPKTSATPDSAAPINVTNNTNTTYYILPTDPPAGVAESVQKEWPRLVKDAKPIAGAEFRFAFSSNDLDRENLAAARQYAEQIAKTCPDQEIIVGGYSDDIGTLEQCREIAMRRAEAVAEQLRARGLKPVVAGFSQAPPDRNGPLTDPADRDKRRVVIIYTAEKRPVPVPAASPPTTPDPTN
ncbi:MAG: OmpA family protein [Verrucomicrobiales bacterium]|nr:OmpA family protein [Verrucomicrobiales bacterium]